MKRYVITSDHHAHLGKIGDVIELDNKQHALTPFAAYLQAAGTNAPASPAMISGSRRRQ